MAVFELKRAISLALLPAGSLPFIVGSVWSEVAYRISSAQPPRHPITHLRIVASILVLAALYILTIQGSRRGIPTA
jgi:hypothetical protein